MRGGKNVSKAGLECRKPHTNLSLINEKQWQLNRYVIEHYRVLAGYIIEYMTGC